ncbi:peptidylprolyl isomerase [Babesia caballi]|uniref:Peptidylprolyl isomerase n=1 Tax=Babesia caballi TaxID=5871 RepID=A0AAV4LWK4_BABCB|nr:peptidylprolyl isomerase [Babesia caballi]
MIVFNFIVLAFCHLFACNIFGANAWTERTLKEDLIEFHYTLDGPDGNENFDIMEEEFKAIGLTELASKARRDLLDVQLDIFFYGDSLFKTFDVDYEQKRPVSSNKERFIHLVVLVNSILKKGDDLCELVEAHYNEGFSTFQKSELVALNVVANEAELKEDLLLADVALFLENVFAEHSHIRRLMECFDEYADTLAQSSHS